MADVTTGGRMPMDGDRHKIQAPSKSVFGDGASPAIPSPKTGIGTTAQAFRVPPNAVAFVMYGSAAGRYGLDATLDGTTVAKGYRVLPATTERILACAGLIGSDIYVRAEAGTITLDFEFRLVGA